LALLPDVTRYKKPNTISKPMMIRKIAERIRGTATLKLLKYKKGVSTEEKKYISSANTKVRPVKASNRWVNEKALLKA
jgi:hypothetical protein